MPNSLDANIGPHIISVGTSCKPPTDHLGNPVHLSPSHTSVPLIMLLSLDRTPIPRNELLTF